jgi:hypothetical protein
MKIVSKNTCVYEFDGKKFIGQGKISNYVGVNISTFGAYLRKYDHNADEAFKHYCSERNIDPEEFLNKIHKRIEEEKAKNEPIININTNNDKIINLEGKLLKTAEVMMEEYSSYKEYNMKLQSLIKEAESALNTMKTMSQSMQTRFNIFEATYRECVTTCKKEYNK